MALKVNWRFLLFIFGALISCLFSVGALFALTLMTTEIGWSVAALIVCVCALPCVLLGLPYLNSRFLFSYTKADGLKITEERRRINRPVKHDRRRQSQ
jgi:hypothetical protein